MSEVRRRADWTRRLERQQSGDARAVTWRRVATVGGNACSRISGGSTYGLTEDRQPGKSDNNPGKSDILLVPECSTLLELAERVERQPARDARSRYVQAPPRRLRPCVRHLVELRRAMTSTLSVRMSQPARRLTKYCRTDPETARSRLAPHTAPLPIRTESKPWAVVRPQARRTNAWDMFNAWDVFSQEKHERRLD